MKYSKHDLIPGMVMQMGVTRTLVKVTEVDCVFDNGTVPASYIVRWINDGSMKILKKDEYEIF